MARWLLRSGFLLTALVLPVLLAPAALIMWLLMPVVVECSRELEERYFCGAAIVVLAGVCCLTMPENVYAISFLWGGCGIGMLAWREQNALKRSLIWTGLSAGVLCLILAWLRSTCPQGIFPGVAEELTAWIDSRPDAGDILLQCYQLGLSRLEDDLQPVLSLFGKLVMTRDVRDQLLYSLRYTLEVSLEAMTPRLIGAWLLLTLVLTTALPDVIRRRHGKRGLLPPFGDWRITEWMRRHLNFMAVVYLLSILVDSPVVTAVGSMCASVFQYAYVILGLAVTEGLTKEFGTVRLIRRLWMVALTLFAPFALVLLGMVDRIFDLRKLAHSMED